MASRVVRLAVAAGLGLALAACRGGPDDPEARVREVLASLEAAAEEGDVARFKSHVSERYADEQGHDRRALAATVTFHVMRNTRRHVFVRVHSVDLRAPDRAEVALAAGLAGSPVESLDDLSRLRAQVWRMDLDLEREADGEWRVVWAQWRPAAAADLI